MASKKGLCIRKIIGKLIIAAFLLSLPSALHSQTSSMGFWGNVIESEAGTRIELTARKESNGEYALSITNRYQTISGESLFLTVNIPSNKVESFKSQLKLVTGKYNEWYKTAKTHKVDYVEKEIPVSLSAYGDIYGSKLSYPEEQEMKAVFYVYNYAIHCIIRVSIYGYNTYQRSEWVMTSADLNKLVTEIDRTIQHQRNYDNKQRRTQDLFQ